VDITAGRKVPDLRVLAKARRRNGWWSSQRISAEIVKKFRDFYQVWSMR